MQTELYELTPRLRVFRSWRFHIHESMTLPMKDSDVIEQVFYKAFGQVMLYATAHDSVLPDYILPALLLYQNGYQVQLRNICKYSESVTRMVGFIHMNFSENDLIDVRTVPWLTQYFESEGVV